MRYDPTTRAGPTSDPNPPTAFAHDWATKALDRAVVAGGCTLRLRNPANGDGRVYFELAREIDTAIQEVTAPLVAMLRAASLAIPRAESDGEGDEHNLPENIALLDRIEETIKRGPPPSDLDRALLILLERLEVRLKTVGENHGGVAFVLTDDLALVRGGIDRLKERMRRA